MYGEALEEAIQFREKPSLCVDFYPNLAFRTHDRNTANQLVNEQTEVALLLGGPMILGMILFAPAPIILCYSATFEPAAKLLRWLLRGNILRIISWPVGYLVIAHARARTLSPCYLDDARGLKGSLLS